MKSRSRSWFVFACLAGGLAFGMFGVACGGSSKPPVTGTATNDGGAKEGGGSYLSTTPPPSGLPPMAAMPPPGVVGSKKAKKKTDAALYACGAGARPSAKDPVDLVKRVGEACAGPSKMKPLSSALFRGQQADKDAAQVHRLRVDANKCYRIYFATDEGVKDAVLVVRDSAGDIVAESPAAALPDDGVFCFNVADEVTLGVGVGSGHGAYAAQVWSD